MSDEYDEKEHEIERQFIFKINIIKAIIQKVSYENDSKDLSKEEYKHYSEMQNLFTNVLLGIVGLMTDKIRDAEEEKAKAIIEAQIKERNEVIANCLILSKLNTFCCYRPSIIYAIFRYIK